MDFFLRHYHMFKYVFIFLASTFIFSYIIVVINKEEEKVETLVVRDDTLAAITTVDVSDEGDYRPLVVMNEAPVGVGISIGKILGYESDIIERTPFDPPIPIGQGYPAMGLMSNSDYKFIRVDVNGHLLCSKVDKSIWKLTPVDKKEVKELKQKVEETTGLNDSLIIRNDAPMPEPSKESMP